MKKWLLGLAFAFALTMVISPAQVAADSDGQSFSFTGGDMGRAIPELDATVAGSAIVLLLGGVAYLASRRRKDD